MFQTEFEFTLPCGYLDDEGTLHREGVMRLATAADEILPLKDPRVQSNEAYLIDHPAVARRSRGWAASAAINPKVIEGLFATDLAFLQDLYNRVNQLDADASVCVHCGRGGEADASARGGAARGSARLPPRSTDEEVAFIAYHFHWPHGIHPGPRAPRPAPLGDADRRPEPARQ